MHEIVTIQLGRRANYLCTHYWNAQESYQTFAPSPPSIIDHDIQFREGLAPDGSTTYLPRTLIYDLKSGFGSFAQTHVMGNSETNDATADTLLWNGSLTRLPPAPQVQASAYSHSLLAATEPVLPTASTTAYFADFASTYFHPRSLIPITPPYPTDGRSASTEITAFAASGSNDMSKFQAGVELFRARDNATDVLDTDTRPWLEECDGLQAVQIFTSSDDTWAGFATQYVEHLRDELGKGCIWVWGIDESSVVGEPGRPKQNNSHRRERALNAALTVNALSEHASMFVPLAVPSQLSGHAHLDRGSLWSTSAFLESAIESSTIATRLKDSDGSRSTMRDWQDVLSEGGRRTIAQLSMDPDFDIQSPKKDSRMRNSDNADEEDSSDLSASISLLPEVDSNSSSKPRSTSRRSKTFSKIQSFRASQNTLDEVLKNFRPPPRDTLLETYCVPLTFPMLPTYPRVFSTSSNKSPNDMRMQTSLQTSSEVAAWIRSLQPTVRFSVGANFGGEEREVLYSSLGDIAEKYVEDWESADESEDDD